MPCVIGCSKLWRPGIAERIEAASGERCVLVTETEDMSVSRLEVLNPRWVFLPHWSFIVPKEVYSRWECVVFHMTDLPFGRGGSPLQNLISRGIYETQISAIRCGKGVDTGPVYMKMPMSLHGGAQEIFLRATDIIEGMILKLIRETPVPKEQVGEATVFSRKRPEDGDVAHLDSLVKMHDWIRMLDADGYPSAFLEVGRFRFEFSRSTYRGDCILADVRISESSK